MDSNDRQAIAGLFDKLAAVARQAPPRDAEAEDFIRAQIAGQPGAPYFMAQTIVVQEQALIAAQARIEDLERANAARPSSGGGLFGGLFGASEEPRSPSAMPRVPRRGGASLGAAQGGGFLAGAAQTALGVAGGVLLGNAIAGMFDGGAAQAAEPPAEEPGLDDGGFDDAGDMEF